MSGRARLRGLRVVGFKSFAERTTLEFGPGISGIVGPNGSGKSNLADALRWALGEQGRSLRTRRSEDVIFAGSATRRAIGLAEVTLTLENGDGLLPIAYGEVGLARRLYRSGENEYLLNGQRVRLRDLTDLLDGANLADNAFLFIGQGMVDQALSLRPEERRPLFEEAAGVRRHERRRRQAEERLEEATVNLARIQDIAAELRPQVRRLAQQAAQQAAREGAGEALAAALVAAVATRWRAAATGLAAADATLHEARHGAAEAAAALGLAEGEATAMVAALAGRASQAREQRDALDAAHQHLTERRVAAERSAAEAAAMVRERARLDTEQADAAARLAAARRTLAVAATDETATPAVALADELAALDQQLAQATAELASLEDGHRSEDVRATSLARAREARLDELARLRRRATEAAGRATEAAAGADAAAAALAAAEPDLAAAVEALATAQADLAAARQARDAAANALAEADAAQVFTSSAAAAVTTRGAAVQARAAAARAGVEDPDASLAEAAGRRGGRRLLDGLVVAPGLEAAVEAALGGAVSASVVERAAVPLLRPERGHLAVRLASGPLDAEPLPAVEAAAAAGGGALVAALQTDPTGVAAQLLRTSVWLPTLEVALSLGIDLPEGWQAVSLDGDVVTAAGLIRLGRPHALLERRAEADRLAVEMADLAAEHDRVVATAATARDRATAARSSSAAAEASLAATGRAVRAAEDQERTAQRRREGLLREAAWARTQAERLAGEVVAATAALPPPEAPPATAPTPAESTSAATAGEAAESWRARAAGLRQRREVAAEALRQATRAAQVADDTRRRAELEAAMQTERLATAEARLAEVATALAAAQAASALEVGERAAAEAAVAAAEAAQRAFEADEGADRERLARAEGTATAQRVTLHTAEEAARRAELVQVESRLGLDAIRQQALTELAGLGRLGITALGATAADDLDEAGLSAELERALALAAGRWTAAGGAPPADAPAAAELAALRRRYHEIGAANPFAAQEHVAVQERLAALDEQRLDLERAIEETRRLIGELSARISDQFQRTFADLERAFGRRFEQLFGGGDAQLLLTEPADLASTGIEIMARPPGKKRQALGMLSGGERALTAVALLFAMLDVHPVPFCVLDEVDAALDEANIGRFTDVLRELAATTQFLVITHNRGTIEAADALYGITIGDDAISRVISLRLAEATELAATAR